MRTKNGFVGTANVEHLSKFFRSFLHYLLAVCFLSFIPLGHAADTQYNKVDFYGTCIHANARGPCGWAADPAAPPKFPTKEQTCAWQAQEQIYYGLEVGTSTTWKISAGGQCEVTRSWIRPVGWYTIATRDSGQPFPLQSDPSVVCAEFERVIRLRANLAGADFGPPVITRIDSPNSSGFCLMTVKQGGVVVGFGEPLTYTQPYTQVDTYTYTIYQLVNTCSAATNSLQSGNACVCNDQYRVNPLTRNACVLLRVDNKAQAGPRSCGFGNPIYPLTGVKRDFVNTGLSLGWLDLNLTYDTMDKAPANGADNSNGLTQPGAFGNLWKSSFHHTLQVGIGLKKAHFSSGDGLIYSFDGDGTGQFTATPNHANKLVFVGGPVWARFTDVSSGLQEEFNSAGNLIKITNRRGEWISFVYTGASAMVPQGYLTGMQDNNGRSIAITVNYGPYWYGPLTQITDVNGRAITPAYDIHRNLVSLTWQDGKAHRFLYENTALPWALTGKIDENNSRYATFSYDVNGQVRSTEYAGGVNKYEVSYTTPPVQLSTDTFDAVNKIINRTNAWAAPVGVSVVLPNGQPITLGSLDINGKPMLLSQSQPAGSGCAASTSFTAHDARGNVVQKDDFSGIRSCFANDLTRNLPLVSITGLSTTTDCASVVAANATLPANSRKTTTQYHPDLSMAVKVAEPLSLTTMVYNGQPDPFNGNSIASCAPASAKTPDGKAIVVLCKQVAQATVDADGSQGLGVAPIASTSAQITTYTYDSFGRMLSTTNGLGKTSTFTYYAVTNLTGTVPDQIGHTVGDLQSITNAAGHITQYTQHDRAGRVRQMIDPKGVVTDTVYTPRGWISSTTVTPPGGVARTTSYSYDNAGQLTGVVMPDATTLAYSYDAAHRLVGVTDAKGNTVTYTLDNMGNRTGEQVKDPQGNLQRNITRVYDALNRVQQTTGASN